MTEQTSEQTTQTTRGTSPTAPPVADAVERYLRFWNARPVERRRTATVVFREDVDYRAPIGTRTGVDDLVRLGEELAEHIGETTFTARTAPDVHHDSARLAWELLRDGRSFAQGTDVLRVDAAGRVASVTTFLDRPPEGFDPQAGPEELPG